MLIRLPEVLSPAAVRRARTLLDQGPWEDGSATAGRQAVAVKNNEQLRLSSPEAQELQALILGALEAHPLFLTAALPKKIVPPQFNRYAGAANAYGNHVDNAIRHLGGQRVRGDLSCTVFLADPDEYEGGELVVEHAFGQERVKLPAGEALLYPASSVHRVEPVTRGMRRASFFWIESLVRSGEQRRILFDLDLALMRLREQHGETDDTVRLMGTYHNLLRLWADT
ncbi:Fe2+-dependent dioxygenase [Inhella gelatinilytica]|uniref:Fe2+-dependent dioxygenase n=1 Tax=Inhella gelatinilytica TaxID=2795030 RepID=A0A931IVP3_9BURK|nr:Fe2+-dependent dioxygenase [Inhella gelatinilytica]MBH9551518.1 Fe2+-dependent dioxygenase [Inhella gelatinilytica]